MTKDEAIAIVRGPRVCNRDLAEVLIPDGGVDGADKFWIESARQILTAALDETQDFQELYHLVVESDQKDFEKFCVDHGVRMGPQPMRASQRGIVVMILQNL